MPFSSSMALSCCFSSEGGGCWEEQTLGLSPETPLNFTCLSVWSFIKGLPLWKLSQLVFVSRTTVTQRADSFHQLGCIFRSCMFTAYRWSEVMGGERSSSPGNDDNFTSQDWCKGQYTHFYCYSLWQHKGEMWKGERREQSGRVHADCRACGALKPWSLQRDVSREEGFFSFHALAVLFQTLQFLSKSVGDLKSLTIV